MSDTIKLCEILPWARWPHVDTGQFTVTTFLAAFEHLTMKLDDLRVHYDRDELRREGLRPDPFEQFALWVREACESSLVEPNAMSLATVGADGRPTQRTVLLKSFDERGFVFYTNLESRKARQISGNANVSLLFSWLALAP